MSSKDKKEGTKRFTISPQEQADLGRRREMYQFENYKSKLLLDAIEAEIDTYIVGIRKRLSIPEDAEIELNLKEMYIEIVPPKPVKSGEEEVKPK